VPAYIRHRVLDIDTLRGLSARYLGDMRRWTELAVLNNLTPDQYGLVGVSELVIPVAIAAVGSSDDPFLTDIAVVKGAYVIDDRGDVVGISDLPNLVASLVRALTTDVGDLQGYPGYGFDLGLVVGRAGSRLMLRSVEHEAGRVIRRDPRVVQVSKIRAIFSPIQRRITITASIQPIGTKDTIDLVAERIHR
jgi:hypothetical protein